MKKAIIVMLLVLTGFAGWACDVCERQQRGLLSGITHGGGPQSNWDYLIIAAMMTVVVATLFFSLKWLIRPGEKGEDHIKRIVLNYD
jgi:hypothetical protein